MHVIRTSAGSRLLSTKYCEKEATKQFQLSVNVQKGNFSVSFNVQNGKVDAQNGNFSVLFSSCGNCSCIMADSMRYALQRFLRAWLHVPERFCKSVEELETTTFD